MLSHERPRTERERNRTNIIRELMDTEQYYNRDMKLLQQYATAISGTVDDDTIQRLFPNLDKIVAFQTMFLRRLEENTFLPWEEQRWGAVFVENEQNFPTYYTTWWATYSLIVERLISFEDPLGPNNNVINVFPELRAFVQRPISRVCKYLLLIESLIKVTSRDEYPWYDELLDGAHAHRRVVDKLNEAQRAEENRITTNNLLRRVEDWKGHVPESLGLLAMDDELVVTKAGVDRLYHVYLFDKILLCCKEVADVKKPQRKHGKTLLSSAQSSAASNRMKLTPLTLKGRIFVYNLSRVIPSLQDSTLGVHWRSDDDTEGFTLHMRNEEHTIRWAEAFNKLITDQNTVGDAGQQTDGHATPDSPILDNVSLDRTPMVPLLIPPQPSERINQQIKVHFNDDIFVLQVPISVDYTDLAAKLAKKIRLCDPNWDSTHLRIKYQDEDGDMVSLIDAEDMRMALESVSPGKVLTLSVK